jgi:hypothetical protein
MELHPSSCTEQLRTTFAIKPASDLHMHTNDEKDPDAGKGAVEQDSPEQSTNTSLSGQLPHRNENPLVKSNDTDYPEPGENPEHSGEPEIDGITREYRKRA